MLRWRIVATGIVRVTPVKNVCVALQKIFLRRISLEFICVGLTAERNWFVAERNCAERIDLLWCWIV